MSDRADENPAAWADRRSRGDGAAARGASGARPGTSGVRMTATAWGLAVALMALAAFVNVMTDLDDARRRGVQMPLALPVASELTSIVAALICVPIVVAAIRLAPPGRGPLWRTLAVYAGGSFAFSGAHVALMTLFRIGLADVFGKRFDWSISEVPYEYRKDLLTYAVFGMLFWLLSRRPAVTAPVGKSAAPATFDIRDGASILRVPVGEIVAATAAGNYVEFALEDGRRPLMRASISSVEAQLAPHGFVRTHRSWLVNAARVRALTAAGSGDFRVDLGCGLTAPLSRRYPDALARLRGEPATLP